MIFLNDARRRNFYICFKTNLASRNCFVSVGLNNGKHLHVIIKHIPCVKNIVPACSFNYHIRYKYNKEHCDPFLLQLLIFLWSLYLPQKWILQDHIHIPKQSNHLQSNYNGNKMKINWTNFRFTNPVHVYTYYMYHIFWDKVERKCFK